MISQQDMYARLRKLIGSPSVDQRNERDLLEHLRASIIWLAAELEFSVVTADLVSLVASDYDYDLPDDLGQLLWVSYNDTALEPSSIPKWTRDRRDWRTVTAATPTEFAFQNRALFVYPRPSAAAVATDGILSIAYVSHSPKITASGVPYLSEADLQVALHRAAWSWAGLNPGTDEAMMVARAAIKSTNETLMTQTLKQALKRHDDPIRARAHKVKMRGLRQGAAR